jgi:acyl-coenzyme A thioesterase PaaI-like protein
MADENGPRKGFAYWMVAAAEAKGAWAAKRRLAAAMRQVIDRLVTSDAPQAELEAAADALERYAEQLAKHPRRKLPAGFSEVANAGDVAGFFDMSPLIGLSNPMSPPIRLRVDGDTVRGTATFGAAYEGPPGHVHGGFVAAAFDEVLGFAQSITGNPGMTGTLTIRYRKPTPLYTELQFEAWVVRVEGRKIFTEGKVYAGELLTAEAEGVFISFDLTKLRQLAEASPAREEAGGAS